MNGRRKGEKRAFISISSSSSDQNEEQSESEPDDDNYVPDHDSIQEISGSTSCSDNSDDYEIESDDQDYDEEDKSSDGDSNDCEEEEEEPIYPRVIRLLGEGCDLQELNLTDCKAYLRKHGLRLSGMKAECINRIKEHWRIKDEDGEAYYPRSSFSINCTGDVCKGDVVLFTQKVYQKFDKMTQRGNLLGKRTIAGRIVKESYGAAKQQHTFTVEVLWSKGIKKLPPLVPLLVKGRNLYKMKTFRQRWKNEEERLRVLDEKHKRGAAARLVRAMKKSNKTFSKSTGLKSRNPLHNRPVQMKHSMKVDKRKGADKRKNSNRHLNKPSPVGHVEQTTKLRPHTSYMRRDQNFNLPNEVRHPRFQSYFSSAQDLYHSQKEFQPGAPLSYACDRGPASSSIMRFPHSQPREDSYTGLTSQHQHLNHGSFSHYGYLNPIHEYRPSFGPVIGMMNTYNPHPQFSHRREPCDQRRYGL